MTRRGALVAASGLALLLAVAAPALAHVEVTPEEVPKGVAATLAFEVPNESATATTTKIEVTFPDDASIPTATAPPRPGWNVTIDPDTPTGRKITWTAAGAGAGIGPDESDEFPVSMGPLPQDVDQVEFRVVQTYDDGRIDRWIEPTPPGGEEPEHPAPVLRLSGRRVTTTTTASTTTTSTTTSTSTTEADEPDTDEVASQNDDDSSSPLPVIALVVGGLVLVAGVGVWLRGRGRRTS